MKCDDVNSKLHSLYEDWKMRVRFTDEQAESLGPPLLLQASEKYCTSQTRVIVFGQETAGWGWTRDLRTNFPDYPTDWPYNDIQSMRDFLENEDSVSGMCWGYNEFSFGRRQPNLSRTPFWQAFSTISSWPDVGIMWNNVVKADYATPGASWSILQAPEETREALITQQTNLIAGEVAALEPHLCLFLTGPYYDPALTAIFPECQFTDCDAYPKRELAKVVDRSLPARSFRTYHPKYLRMAGKWEYLEYFRAAMYR